nr:MAG TPA: hypothetical protein [Caudoviricetes sp.]
MKANALLILCALEPKKTQGLSLVKCGKYRKFIGRKCKVNTKKMQREKATRTTLRFTKVL